MTLKSAPPSGGGYTLELCVATTATYGDRFRPVLIHELTPVEGGTGGGTGGNAGGTGRIAFR